MAITSCNSVIYWFLILKNTYACVIEIFGCLFELMFCLCHLFVKTVKTIPFSFNKMNWLLFYTLAKHLQPNQKFLNFFDDLWTPFQRCFHVCGSIFCNCKQSIRSLLVCFVMHFWMKNCFQLLGHLLRSVRTIWSKCLSRLGSKLLVVFLIGATTVLAF